LLVWKTPAVNAQTYIFPYVSDYVRTLLDDPNAATARTTLGVVTGSGGFQAWDTDLDWLAANLNAFWKTILVDANSTELQASLGYLTAESDPVFLASDANDITSAQKTNWDSAYSASHAAVTLAASATTGGMSLSTQEIAFRAATNAQTGYATAAHISAIETNTAKVTNATHTGQVTGSTALTVNKTAITGQSAVTAASDDYVLISDTGDSGNLKKALVSDFAGGSSLWTADGNDVTFPTGNAGIGPSKIWVGSAGTDRFISAGGYPIIPVPDSNGIVGWWKANSSPNDSSGLGNDGTLEGGATYATGVYAQAFSLDGTGDYVDCGSAYVDAGATALSISMWFKADTTAGNKGLFAIGAFGGTADIVSIYINNSVLTAYSGTGTASVAFTDTSSWHHVALVYASSTVTLYLDGVAVKTGVFPSSINFTGKTTVIGSHYILGSYDFDGLIDDVRLYSRDLSADEIQALYLRPELLPNFISADPNCVGYWKLDEGTGTSAADSSTSGNDGTLTNSPTWASGIAGGAVYFDNGSTEHIAIADSAILEIDANAPYTASSWVKCNNANATQTIINKWDASLVGMLWDLKDGKSRFIINNEIIVSGATDLRDNEWHHLVSTFDGSNSSDGVYIYVDNIEEGVRPGTPTVTTQDPANADPLYIGSRRGTSYGFYGWIDDVIIYNRALDVNDILSLYTYPGENTDVKPDKAADGSTTPIPVIEMSATDGSSSISLLTGSSNGALGTAGLAIEDGVATFTGTSTGFPYAYMYAQDAEDEITISGDGEPNKVQVTSFNADGPELNLDADHTNDHITVGTDGVYEILISGTINSVAGGAYRISFNVYKNNGATALTGLHLHHDFAGGGSEDSSLSIVGLVSLSATDTIELWVFNDTDDTNVVVDDISMVATMKGGN
jgi:hypothetical protein